MTAERLFSLLSELPDDLIDDAASTKKRKGWPVGKWTALAACCAVVLLGGILFLPSLSLSKDASLESCAPQEPASQPAADTAASPETGLAEEDGEARRVFCGLASESITIKARGDSQPTTIDDKEAISGLYTVLEAVEARPIAVLCAEEMFVTVDLKNGIRFGLCACQTGEGVLFGAADEIDQGLDFGPELVAYVMGMLP